MKLYLLHIRTYLHTVMELSTSLHLLLFIYFLCLKTSLRSKAQVCPHVYEYNDIHLELYVPYLFISFHLEVLWGHKASCELVNHS